MTRVELLRAMLAYTEEQMPQVHEAARTRFQRGEDVEDLLGMISDDAKLGVMATVVTRAEAGLPRWLELLQRRGGDGPKIAADLERRDPHTLYVLTFFQGEVMVTPVPVMIVLDASQA